MSSLGEIEYFSNLLAPLRENRQGATGGRQGYQRLSAGPYPKGPSECGGVHASRGLLHLAHLGGLDAMAVREFALGPAWAMVPLMLSGVLRSTENTLTT